MPVTYVCDIIIFGCIGDQAYWDIVRDDAAYMGMRGSSFLNVVMKHPSL